MWPKIFILDQKNSNRLVQHHDWFVGCSSDNALNLVTKLVWMLFVSLNQINLSEFKFLIRETLLKNEHGKFLKTFINIRI